MRRAIVAAVRLGAVAALVFIHRDSLRITAAWPVILGFALWDSVGERGSRGFLAAIAAGAGTAGAYAVFLVVSEFLPITQLSLGLATGVAVAGIVGLSLVLRKWFPVSAPLIGFAAFYGVFEPLWRVSPSNFLRHGLDSTSVVGLGLVIGALTASLVRWLTEGVRVRSAASSTQRAEEPTAPLSDVLEGGASQ
jgi:hypothetical protein